MKNQSKLITGFFLVGLVVIFSVINTATVDVNFGFTKIQSPLIFIILGSTILGALIVFVTWFSSFWGQRKEIKRLKKQVLEYDEQLAAKIEHGMAAERSLAEQELQMKQARIDELEQQFSELSGELFLEEPTVLDD